MTETFRLALELAMIFYGMAMVVTWAAILGLLFRLKNLENRL